MVADADGNSDEWMGDDPQHLGCQERAALHPEGESLHATIQDLTEALRMRNLCQSRSSG